MDKELAIYFLDCFDYASMTVPQQGTIRKDFVRYFAHVKQ